jgi:hypothetical protein
VKVFALRAHLDDAGNQIPKWAMHRFIRARLRPPTGLLMAGAALIVMVGWAIWKVLM